MPRRVRKTVAPLRRFRDQLCRSGGSRLAFREVTKTRRPGQIYNETDGHLGIDQEGGVSGGWLVAEQRVLKERRGGEREERTHCCISGAPSTTTARGGLPPPSNRAPLGSPPLPQRTAEPQVSLGYLGFVGTLTGGRARTACPVSAS